MSVTTSASAKQSAQHPKPQTLGELKRIPDFDAGRVSRSVKDEMRSNLLRNSARRSTLPGHSRLRRHRRSANRQRHSLPPQFHSAGPARPGQKPHPARPDRPARRRNSRHRRLRNPRQSRSPSAAAAATKSPQLGDDTPIAWLTREERYVEKLATPDVTIADLIGDIDPIKAARGGHDLGSELTVHYGLLPRANRGIFAINELPDLAGKIQVGLFNIMQEGDVQIKGYPVRLPLDVLLVFTANPEDYTARGKIITPLKDRIGSEIRTHYPATVDEGIAITEQEAWTERARLRHSTFPTYIREVVEQSPSPRAKTSESTSAPALASACRSR